MVIIWIWNFAFNNKKVIFYAKKYLDLNVSFAKSWKIRRKERREEERNEKDLIKNQKKEQQESEYGQGKWKIKL